MNFEYEINTLSKISSGQQTGTLYPNSELTCKDLNLQIELGYFRSIKKNEELLYKTLQFIIEEIKNENINKF